MSFSRKRLHAGPWRLIRGAAAGAGRASGTLRVWLWWEALTLRWWRVRPVRASGLLGFSTRRHRGTTVTLRDGAVVRPGSAVVELHLDNKKVLALARQKGGIPWRALGILDADLRELAARLEEPDLRDVVAVHGVTILASASRRLGFEVHPLRRSPSVLLMRYFFVGLIAVYHPDGWRHVDRVRHALWPGEVWMSRAALAAHRGDAGSCRRSRPQPLLAARGTRAL